MKTFLFYLAITATVPMSIVLVLSACGPSIATLDVQAATVARTGDLAVYKSLDAGWQRAVIRGSVCADESIIRNNEGPFKSDPQVICPDASVK